MKILKLIGLVMLVANFVTAQTTYSAPHTASGNNNTILGVDAGTSSTIGNNNVAIGFEAFKSGTGINNTCIGYQAAGLRANTGIANVFIGTQSGLRLTSGSNNVGIGESTLSFNTSGQSNLAFGKGAGYNNTTGQSNIFMGINTGIGNATGSGNTYIGSGAGNGQDGSNNVALGNKSGRSAADNTSSFFSLFLGSNAGKNRATGKWRELYIQNQTDADANNTPLVYGTFPYTDAGGNRVPGKLGIDTENIPSDYTLAVNGKTITEEVQVMEFIDWPDYVFADDYNLMSLTDLEAEIETLGHLPGVPSAEEVEANGHALGSMDAILLEKIEELTLHLIDMNKEMETLRNKNEVLETRLSEVEDK